MRVDLYIEVMYMTFLVPGYNVTALNVDKWLSVLDG